MLESILGMLAMVITYFVADALLKSTVSKNKKDGTKKTKQQIEEEAYTKTADTKYGCWFVILILVILVIVVLFISEIKINT